MKNNKLKFLEEGRLSKKSMNSLFGGAKWSCGTYTNCHETGKSSCDIWSACNSGDTDKKTECDDGTALQWVHSVPIASQVMKINEKS